MRVLNGFTAWPDTATDLTTEKMVEMYQAGFAGAFQDPEASEELDDSIREAGGVVNGDDLATSYGFAGDGAGKLTILFPAVTKYYGVEALTKPGQKTGDCVSMMIRDGGLYLICLEGAAGLPDERTGKIELPPTVSDTARRNGVFINEGAYLAREHNGQGMACSQGVKWVTTKGGIIVRQKFAQADLESYNVDFEVKGKNGVPAWLNEVGRQHPIHDVTRPKGEEAARDFLDRGKPIGVCSGLGFSSKRDANGFSKKQGGWSHSWHVVGYDDRPWAHETYGHPLALFGHRWAVWNSGPRRIHGTDIDIPEGYAWIDARLLRQCEMYAFSGANGWASSNLPDYNPGF